MTVLMKMTRTDAARKIAQSRQKLTGNVVPYHTAMVDAIELVDGLEVLGVIRFDEAAAKEGQR